MPLSWGCDTYVTGSIGHLKTVFLGTSDSKKKAWATTLSLELLSTPEAADRAHLLTFTEGQNTFLHTQQLPHRQMLFCLPRARGVKRDVTDSMPTDRRKERNF